MPLLGPAGNFVAFLRDPPAYLRRLHATFGDIAALARGDSRLVFVFSPAYNQWLLSDTALFHNLDASSSPVRIPAGSALGRLYAGLTNMNGPRHQAHRRLMAAAFTRQRVDRLARDIVELSQQRVATWRPGDERDLLVEMRELTLAVAVKSLLGLDPEHEGRRTSRLLQTWMDLVFSIPALVVPLDVPGLPYRRLLRVSALLEGEIRAMLAERRATQTRGPDLLSLLLDTRDDDGVGLTDDELIGQTSFLCMAGHATTASALAWTLLLLDQHPAVAAAVLAELDVVLAGQPPGGPHTSQLPLLERVLKESLRLLPPVLWWSRVSTAACEVGPYRLAAGTRVGYSAFITHRRPELYSQPNRFRPQRWLEEPRGAYEYLPFSAGPRSCLGAAFAMLEMKLVLAVILQRVGLRLRPGARVDRGGLMISQPRPGLPMIVGWRDPSPTRAAVQGSIRSLVDFD